MLSENEFDTSSGHNSIAEVNRGCPRLKRQLIEIT